MPHENTDSTILTLAKDVLALTKVNWNTTQFDQKLPAPIKAAREVGDAFDASLTARAHALSALSMACRLCAREVKALEDETLAQEFVRVRGWSS